MVVPLPLVTPRRRGRIVLLWKLWRSSATKPTLNSEYCDRGFRGGKHALYLARWPKPLFGALDSTSRS